MKANYTGKPDIHHYGCCWAVVQQPSYGAMYRSMENCSRKARPGKLTCAAHDYLEADAQSTKVS